MPEKEFEGKNNKRSNFFKQYTAVWEAFFAIVLGFLIGGLVIGWSGFDAIAAILRMIEGGFGSGYYLTTTLTRATPIIFAGFASALAWGSGYSSLGASGQMILGAMTASQVAISIDGPPFVIITLSILGGMAAGMVYSFISGWISDKFQIYLLIVTLMMNYLADNIASYFTHYFIKDPFGLDSSAIQTQKIEVGFLPRIFSNYTTHYGLIIALVIGGILWFMKYRTVFGYRTRMGGLNALFAEYGGLNSKKMMYSVLLLSGAMAGMGGACEVLGTRFRYVDGMISSSGYVWSGIIASLIANNHPIGTVFSSIFLAGLTTGGSAVERSMGVPSEVSAIIQSIITLLMTAKFIVSYRHGKFGIFKRMISKIKKRTKSIGPGKVESK